MGPTRIRESVCESREDVRFPLGKSGRELPWKSGKLPGNLWIAVKFYSERTSGEVARQLPGSLTPSQRLAKFVSKRNIPEQVSVHS